jgi:hypothetical protein
MPPELGPPNVTNPILGLPNGKLVISVEILKRYEDRFEWYEKVVYC